MYYIIQQGNLSPLAPVFVDLWWEESPHHQWWDWMAEGQAVQQPSKVVKGMGRGLYAQQHNLQYYIIYNADQIATPVDIEMTGAARVKVFKTPLLPTEQGQSPV